MLPMKQAQRLPYYEPVYCDTGQHVNDLGLLKAKYGDKTWFCEHNEHCEVSSRVVNEALQSGYFSKHKPEDLRTARNHEMYRRTTRQIVIPISFEKGNVKVSSRHRRSRESEAFFVFVLVVALIYLGTYS